MKWGLVIASRAKRHFRRIPPADRDAIDAAFFEMCDDPFSGDFKVFRAPMDCVVEYVTGASSTNWMSKER